VTEKTSRRDIVLVLRGPGAGGDSVDEGCSHIEVERGLERCYWSSADNANNLFLQSMNSIIFNVKNNSGGTAPNMKKQSLLDYIQC
jgi:hypothetical protein